MASLAAKELSFVIGLSWAYLLICASNGSLRHVKADAEEGLGPGVLTCVSVDLSV